MKKVISLNEWKDERIMNRRIKELIDTLQKNEYTEQDVYEASEMVLEKLKYNTIPVPIVHIVEEFGFQVYQNDMEDKMSGFIVVDKKWEKEFHTDKLIVVNSEHNLGHKRFTIAHELGHYLLDYKEQHKSYYDAYMQSRAEYKEERRVNQFAANLLMPRMDFIDAYNEVKNSGKNIIALLSEKFEVSARAIETRMKELKLE